MKKPPHGGTRGFLRFLEGETAMGERSAPSRAKLEGQHYINFGSSDVFPAIHSRSHCPARQHHGSYSGASPARCHQIVISSGVLHQCHDLRGAAMAKPKTKLSSITSPSRVCLL